MIYLVKHVSESASKMTIQVYWYLTWLLPLVLIPIFSLQKRSIYFIIGIQLSFYISHSLYTSYLDYDFYHINDVWKIRIEAIESHRSILFFNWFKSIFVIFIYVMCISILFLYFQKYQDATNKIRFKNFLKTYTFYIILAIGAIIDILMGMVLTVKYWNFSILSPFLVIISLWKVIKIKYFTSKKNHQKTSIFTWFLLILCIIYFIYVFWERGVG